VGEFYNPYNDQLSPYLGWIAYIGAVHVYSK